MRGEGVEREVKGRKNASRWETVGDPIDARSEEEELMSARGKPSGGGHM